MCAIKTVEPKVDEEGFVAVSPSKAASAETPWLLRKVTKVETAKSFKVPEEEKQNKFVFQENHDLYIGKAKTRTDFAEKEDCL